MNENDSFCLFVFRSCLSVLFSFGRRREEERDDQEQDDKDNSNEIEVLPSLVRVLKGHYTERHNDKVKDELCCENKECFKDDCIASVLFSSIWIVDEGRELALDLCDRKTEDSSRKEEDVITGIDAMPSSTESESDERSKNVVHVGLKTFKDILLEIMLRGH